MNDFKADLARRLKQAAQESGIKQRQIAEACGKTEGAVSQWMRTGSIRAEHLAKICGLTGVSADYLLLGTRGMTEERRWWIEQIERLTPEQKLQLKGIISALRGVIGTYPEAGSEGRDPKYVHDSGGRR